MGVTEYQIWWVKHHRLTSQKTKTGRCALLHTPQKRRLKEWLLASPSYRRIPWRHIPYYLPEIDAKEDAIYTAFRELGYCRRTSKKKGFSDDPVVWVERKAFAEDAITWSRERLQIQNSYFLIRKAVKSAACPRKVAVFSLHLGLFRGG